MKKEGLFLNFENYKRGRNIMYHGPSSVHKSYIHYNYCLKLIRPQ